MECEVPEFYVHKEATARKLHKCCECGTVIEKGEKYFWCVGKWDGHIETHRQHLVCMEACMLIRDEFEGECIAFGALFEWWGEYKWDYDRTKERGKEKWAKLRHLLAIIRWRQRRGQ
jgi:hypothetical protein